MKRLYFTAALATTLSLTGLVQHAVAQVAADGSLSTSVTTSDSRNFVIDGGDRAGGNLFHSFREFSVPTGGSASFNNAADVQNIFSRVTGGNISNIDGLIRANGTANLFLLNPAGIVFGPNAILNIGGSFVGSTADRLRFSDGTVFNATAASAAPLLTVSAPVGLQLGNTPGKIQVNGAGNQEILPTTHFGLAVTPGHTLALVGGAITFDGGIATAAAGRLEIGSVAQGEVSLTPSPVGWSLGYGQVQQFQDAQFLNRSSLWMPASNAAGSIQVHANRVTLNNSQIAATSGAQPGGNIVIQAADSLDLRGLNVIYPFSSWIVNQVTPGGSGQGGQIQLDTPQLTLQEGSRIQTLSQGSGAAGEIRVNANSVQISGASPASISATQQDFFHSRISSDALASGNGGDIRISAQQITLRQGGQVGSLVGNQATGHGGNIIANVSGSIAAIGVDPFDPTINSGFASLTAGAGAGGNLRISGDRIVLLDGGVLESITLGTGQGGDIEAHADRTLTARRPSARLVGGLASFTLGSAKGGNILISTDRLSLYDGAGIYAATLSQSANPSGVPSGNSGNVTVNARQSIHLAGVRRSPVSPSTISTVTITSGTAGNITLSTRRLIAEQGGAIASSTLFEIGGGLFRGAGTGNGGNVRVNASESTTVRGIDSGTALPGTIETPTLSRGTAGNVVIQTPRLTVQTGGLVGSVNIAAGEAGQVVINADNILVRGVAANGTPAQIFSTARISDPTLQRTFNLPPMPRGNTGTLSLNADRIAVEEGGLVNVRHEGIGNAGQLSLNANTLTLQSQGRITAATAAGQGGNIQLTIRDAVLLNDRAQISTTAGDSGSGGNIDIQTPFLIGLHNSDIVAQAQRGSGGNIAIATQGLLGIAPSAALTAASDINASSQLGLNGTVNVTTPNVNPESGLVKLPAEVTDASQQVAQTCTASQASRFVVTGRGGIPENPTQALSSDRTWQDLRDLSGLEQPNSPEATQAESNPSAIQEASGWRLNQAGQVELVAAATTALPQPATCSVH